MKKKIITYIGLTKYFFGIEVAGTIAYFITAFIMFIFMIIATQGDWFASLFYPLFMVGLWVFGFIWKVLEFLFKKQ